MSKAFDGVRVVDFTQVLSGPVATGNLAQLGAEDFERVGRAELGVPGFVDHSHGPRPKLASQLVGSDVPIHSGPA